MALKIEVNEHPEQYIEGMERLCVSASFHLPAGFNAHAPAVQSELVKIVEIARQAGFSVNIEQGRRSQSLYVDVCTDATSPDEFRQQQAKATSLIAAVTELIKTLIP